MLPWGKSPETQEMSPSVASERQGWFLGITRGFSGEMWVPGLQESLWWERGSPQSGRRAARGLPGSWHSCRSLPHEEEEEELSSLLACSRIIPRSLLIPPRKPGWAFFFFFPRTSLKCNFSHQDLLVMRRIMSFIYIFKWSDIRHPIIPTPRERHGPDV